MPWVDAPAVVRACDRTRRAIEACVPLSPEERLKDIRERAARHQTITDEEARLIGQGHQTISQNPPADFWDRVAEMVAERVVESMKRS